MTKYSRLLSISDHKKLSNKVWKKKKWPKLMAIKLKGYMHLQTRRAVKLTLLPTGRGKDSVDLPNLILASVFNRLNKLRLAVQT